MAQRRDEFGFGFWLGWIVWFAGSFLAAACFWTFLIRALFGRDWPGELTFSWCAAVFGTWFLLTAPFMRKKERIWKRLNPFQEQAVTIWLIASNALILSLIAGALGWAWFYRDEMFAAGRRGIYGPWVKAVAATVLTVLLPVLVMMYRKAEILVQGAVESMTPRQAHYRRQVVPRRERLLPAGIREELKKSPAVLRDGQIVHLKLKDGRKIPHVFVRHYSEIIGLYEREAFDFNSDDIEDIEYVNAAVLPAYDETKWLRLDERVPMAVKN